MLLAERQAGMRKELVAAGHPCTTGSKRTLLALIEVDESHDAAIRLLRVMREQGGSRVGSALIQLFPPVLGSIAMPTWVLLVLALRSTAHGPLKAIAFVGGITTVRLAQGVIFGTVLSLYEISHHLNTLGTIVPILLIIIGLLLWALAFRQVFQRSDMKLLSMVSTLTPMRALGLGALLAVTSSRGWLFTLAALSVIDRAGLDTPYSIVAYLLYVLGAEVLVIAPILLSPRSSARSEAAAHWLDEKTSPIVITASLIVGCFFLWNGLAGIFR
jgi:cytochrome c biogenesis protein CcdA